MFIFPLLSICEFCHTNSALSVVEFDEKLVLHFFPAIGGFGLQVSVLLKAIPLRG